MLDREKVIEALECADMTDGVIKMSNQFRDIVVELLKEHEAVVRCNDCKYRFVDGDNVRFNMCLLNHNKVQPDDWFCDDGERRADT